MYATLPHLTHYKVANALECFLDQDFSSTLLTQGMLCSALVPEEILPQQAPYALKKRKKRNAETIRKVEIAEGYDLKRRQRKRGQRKIESINIKHKHTR